MDTYRQRLRALVEHPRFQTLTMLVILLNALTLGLETSSTAMGHMGPFLVLLDHLALAYFTAEVALRMVAHGRRFFPNGWNLFDLAIVAASLLPHSGSLSVLRSLRILRVLRLFSLLPSLRRVVGALVSSVPAMASIAVVLGLVFYVFSVLTTKLFGTTHPEFFGDLGSSMYTLFQLMTLDGWSDGIVRPMMRTHPLAWMVFIPFIVVTSFAVLNLFIGVLVSGLQDEAASRPPVTPPGVPELREEVQTLRAQLDEVLRRLPPPL